MLSLGQKISEGDQHEVYEDADDPSSLIKVPKPGCRFNLATAQRYVDLMDRHFPKWHLPTEVILGNGGYYIIQERVDEARHLRPSHLAIPNTRETLEEIAEANRRARRDSKVTYDFLGTAGWSRGARLALPGQNAGELELLNVLLSTQNDIHLCGLLFPLEDPSILKRIHAQTSTRVHHLLIQRHFGVDLSA